MINTMLLWQRDDLRTNEVDESTGEQDEMDAVLISKREVSKSEDDYSEQDSVRLEIDAQYANSI
ncbi:MAG: hypothetical protein WA667_08490 [Candidatus Nitrosopolaris sp.]